MNNYSDYKAHLRKIADLGFASSVLSWDQECYMPPMGAQHRAQQLSTLAGIAHELFTRSDFGELLEKLSEDKSLDEKQRRNVKCTLKDYRQRKKYSTSFVEELSKCISEAFQAWQAAREKNSFAMYGPFLDKLVQMKREECGLLGYEKNPYDALLDQYEPGATTDELNTLFSDVRRELVGFVKKIRENKAPDDSFMHAYFEKNKQWDFGINLLKQMGYNFDAGRQDLSTHPFTINFGPLDVRVTTRVSENNLNEMIWSCIHEGGHALYEQGLPSEEYGLPSGEAISLGIHESQSRLWENNVGRSRSYWEHNYPKLKSVFPEQLKNVSIDSFYAAMNLVQPSLIRTSADELTYHFHVMIRFEIEQELIGKKLEVKDLPERWNASYKSYLGLDVPDDKQGVLQDIHWSHGSFGYFPTYSLGSFYAAQFFRQAQKEIPGLDEQIRKGELNSLLEWLREKVHKHGKFHKASELCEIITGEKLNFSYFMEYAKAKYGELYKL